MVKLNVNAWKSLLRRAGRGDPDAQCEVGLHYRDGIRDEAGGEVVRANHRKSLQWLLRAAEQGNCCAQNQLGVALTSGRGVPVAKKSAARARELLELADRDGDHEGAQALLRVLGRSLPT